MPSYGDWNAALGEFFLGHERPGQAVAVGLDDELLLEVARENGLCFEDASAEEAALSFGRAVREEVEENGWESKPPRTGVLPEALAKCCLFALAYSRTEGGAIGRPAFWPEVWRLLDPDESPPMGLPGPDCVRLTGEQFQRLWRLGLARWVNELEGGKWGRLHLPERRSGASCHVQLVRSQAGLRRLDLQRLPRLFRTAGLQAKDQLSAERLWEATAPFFGRLRSTTRAVFSDPARRDLAMAQLSEAFSSWDGGERLDSFRRPRRAQLRLWFQLRGERLESGVLKVDAEGRERIVSGPPPLEELLTATEPRVIDGGWYRPKRQGLVLGVFDEFDEWYLEELRTKPGDRALLIVPDDRADEVASWAATVADEIRQRTEMEGVPTAWQVLELAIREDRAPVTGPDLCRDLVAATDGLHLQGGLRLHRNCWMEGAGPQIAVSKADHETDIVVDGESVRTEHGLITPRVAPALDRVGWHEVRSGDCALSFAVVPPRKASIDPTPAWVLASSGSWPQRARGTDDPSAEWTIDGPLFTRLSGEASESAPMLHTWLEEVVALAREGTQRVPHHAARRPHPLVQLLRQARHAPRGSRQ